MTLANIEAVCLFLCVLALILFYELLQRTEVYALALFVL